METQTIETGRKPLPRIPADSLQMALFRKAWDESGLAAYYERMDKLSELGFDFGGGGDMDRSQYVFLTKWLEGCDVTAVGVNELASAAPLLRLLAELRDMAASLLATSIEGENPALRLVDATLLRVILERLELSLPSPSATYHAGLDKEV